MSLIAEGGQALGAAILEALCRTLQYNTVAVQLYNSVTLMWGRCLRHVDNEYAVPATLRQALQYKCTTQWRYSCITLMWVGCVCGSTGSALRQDQLLH